MNSRELMARFQSDANLQGSHYYAAKRAAGFGDFDSLHDGSPSQLSRMSAILWPEEQGKATFRIGVTYRQRNGELVRLEAYPADSHPARAGYVRAVRLSDGLPLGPRDAKNGHAFSYETRHRAPLAGDLVAEHIGVKLADCKPTPTPVWIGIDYARDPSHKPKDDRAPTEAERAWKLRTLAAQILAESAAQVAREPKPSIAGLLRIAPIGR